MQLRARSLRFTSNSRARSSTVSSIAVLPSSRRLSRPTITLHSKKVRMCFRHDSSTKFIVLLHGQRVFPCLSNNKLVLARHWRTNCVDWSTCLIIQSNMTQQKACKASLSDVLDASKWHASLWTGFLSKIALNQ